jgi:hypothetical protein
MQDEIQKTNHQLTSNSDTPTDSGELPTEDIFDVCLTDPDDPEETILELSRPNRSPPHK